MNAGAHSLYEAPCLMIVVKLELHGELRDALGREVIMSLPDGTNVIQLLQRVVEQAGEKFKQKIYDSSGRLLPHPLLKVEVNTSDCEFEQELKDGDRASVFIHSVIGGG